MQNLSNKLLAITEISNEIFGGELENTYVISIWDKSIQFSSHHKKSIAAKAVSMDGAVIAIDRNGFTTISFKYFDLTIEIILA